MYYLSFSKNFVSSLELIPPSWRYRVEGACQVLASDPLSYTTYLQSPWNNYRVYESYPYQIFCRVFEKEQIIVITGIRPI